MIHDCPRTSELPPRSYCAGSCGANIFDHVGADGMAADFDALGRWTSGYDEHGLPLLYCPDAFATTEDGWS